MQATHSFVAVLGRNTYFLLLLAFLVFIPVSASTAESLTNMRANKVEVIAAGPSGPTGEVFYSVRAYGSGAHDYIHDLTASQRGSGYRIISAQMKNTGARWVYLATRHQNGEIRRTYFDLSTGGLQRAGWRLVSCFAGF